ncbi:MAG TPA: AMP-binding protein [Acidimicrobiia bacterium]|nr:AMP-binding protein [Acidimicrobiia bacterium]
MVSPSYVSGTASTPLIGQTIGDHLDGVVAMHPDNLCLVSRHQEIRWSYADFLAEVERCARAFLALGVERGDRIGIWAPNRAEWTVVQYATAKIGAILVNVNPSYRSHELSYALNQSGVTVLVRSDDFKGVSYSETLESVRSQVPRLETDIGLGKAGSDLPWEDFLDRADHVAIDVLRSAQAVLEFDDPINIQYTSGTTGNPKGATLTHHNILNNGYFVTGIQGLGPGSVLCVPVPLYHCFGMVMGNLGMLSRGGAVVYPAEAFDPTATLAAIGEESCEALYGVPTMFIAMLDDPSFAEAELATLRTGIMAGSPCPVEVMKRVISDMNMEGVTIAYGMTETSPVSFQSRTDDPIDRRVSTVGRIMPHVESKIIDPESGNVRPRGEPGELCTRGYSVMRGYWDNPEATGEAIDEAGWMHSGDLAMMDEEGYVNIVGRIKDMVIRGGENIYPREVEEFLYGHPAIVDVQVIGVPDVRYGEELCAWVRLREGQQLSLEELRDFCSGRIANYKIPRYLRVTDEFPLTVTGKVQKFKMRETSIEELGLAAAASVRTA